MAEFVARFRSANRERQSRVIAAAPVSTGDPRWDALIAALAEWLAVTSRIATPAWVHTRTALSKPWWVSPMKSLQAWEYAGTPAAFQDRAVLIHRDSLVNV